MKNSLIYKAPERKEALLSDARRLQQPSVGTKDLETILGRLGFAAGVLRGARAFTCRPRRCFLRAQTAGAPDAQLDPAAHEGAKWWVDTLTSPLPAVENAPDSLRRGLLRLPAFIDVFSDPNLLITNGNTFGVHHSDVVF